MTHAMTMTMAAPLWAVCRETLEDIINAPGTEPKLREQLTAALASIREPGVAPTHSPVTHVCPTCGTDKIFADAWAQWDNDAQTWEVAGTYDHGYCFVCDGEITHYESKALEPAAA